MNKKQFRVNDLVKFNYSEIGKYVDENHTDRPLRNDEVCDLLNEQQATINHLEKVYGENFAKRRLLEKDNLILRKENEQLRKELDNFKPVIFQDMRKGTVILYSKGD